MTKKSFLAVVFFLLWLAWPSAGVAQSQLDISREFDEKSIDSPSQLDDLCGEIKITGGTGWLFIELTVSPTRKGNVKMYRGQDMMSSLYLDCGPYFLPDIVDHSATGSYTNKEPKETVVGQPVKWTSKMKLGRNLKPFTMKICRSGTMRDYKPIQFGQNIHIKAVWVEGEKDPGNIWDLTSGQPPSGQALLGRVWHTTEAGGWTGTWTRRGDSLVFDAVWVNGGQRVTGVFTMIINSRTIRFQSRQQSNKHDVDYEGTLSSAGRSASGTLRLLPSGSAVGWDAKIEY